MKYPGLFPLLVLFLAGVVAEAQPLAKRVTFSYRNEPLGSVLTDISRKHQVRFSYSSYYVPVDQRVSVAVVDAPLKHALDTLFSGTAIVYASIGGQIVLRSDRGRLAQLEAMRARPLPNPTPLIDEKMIAERSRLRTGLPAIEGPATHELPGGDRYRDLDLEKYRRAIVRLDIPVERNEPKRPRSDRRTAQVSLLPFLGTNTYESAELTNNMSLNVFWGANGGVDGVEVGGFVNTVIKDVKGVQVAGMGNTVGGSVTGTQLAGLFNVNGGTTQGVQFAGFFNITRRTDALQIGGVFNVAAQDASGAQVAGLFNVGSGRVGVQVATLFNTGGDTARTQVAGLFNAAGDVRGAQVSTLFNKARRVDGLQIGLVNVADTVGGASFGVLNFVKKGYNRLEVAGGEALYTNLGLKLGTRGFYNILQVGARWDRRLRTTDQQSQNGIFMSWGLGYGLGTAVAFSPRWMMNIEAVAIHVNELERWTRELNLLNQLRLTVDYRTGGRVSFFGGPVGNLMVSRLRDPETGAVAGTSIAPYTFFDRTRGDTNVRMWVGFQGGVRF